MRIARLYLDRTTHPKRNNGGFTLIEILIVIAIISILTGLVTNNFRSSHLKGKDARRKGDLNQLQTALEKYYNDFSRYPAADQGKIAVCGSGGTSVCEWGEPFVNAAGTTYMVRTPRDPSSPRLTYLYVVSTTGRSYQLFARLENQNDSQNQVYSGKTCGATTSDACTYGVSSPNTLPSATTLP